MPKLIAHNLKKTEQILRDRGKDPEIPLKTLPALNRKIWGLHSKKLTIIAARTSNGKSAMALQLAYDTASQGISTLFVSLEMYEEDVIERLFCLERRVSNECLRSGKFAEVEKDWDDFKKNVEEMPFVITDMLGKDWKEIDAYLQNLTIKPRVIIIDHLQEARGALSLNQKEVIDEYLKTLRIMAIRDNFALIICSQINRAAQGQSSKEPQLHNLKNSGYIEEGADIVILLHWPWHATKSGDKSNYIINVAKNRNGRTGWINVKYKPEYYLFYEEPESVKEEKEPQVDWQN